MKSPNHARRTALKHLAYASGTLALAPLLSFCQSTPAAEKLGVAVVGLGNYATRQVAPALQHTKFCELRGIVTGTPEKAKTWQQQYKILPENTYNYETFDRIADNPAIDIIYIVLPNFMHAEYTIRALKTGKHVICEKPMAMNPAECRQMIAAAKAAKRKLQIGYRLFYEPHHLELKKRAQAAEVKNSRLRLVEASLGFDMAHPGMWRIDKDKGGGGALMDLGPYTIQAARRAVGKNPVSVRAQGFKDDPNLYKGIYGTYSWQLRFDNTAICNSTVSFSSYLDRMYMGYGSNYLELQPSFNASAKLTLTTQTETIQLPTNEFQQTAQLDAFASNILDDTDVLASGEEGLIDMQIIAAIKQSIEEGREVEIDY